MSRTASDRAPIIILGVPRSGTTLLRTLLDAHPAIACGPETPWLAPHQRASVLGLARYMRESELGYCKSFNQPASVVEGAAGRFIDEVMRAYATSRGKRRWAEKTPNNAMHLEELARVLPGAVYVWITRAPLDVAHSTTHVPDHRRGINTLYERRLRLSPDRTTPSTPLAALVRWIAWNRRIGAFLGGADGQRPHHHLTYERLVTDTEGALTDLCGFLGEPFGRAEREAMLAYDTSRHDLPAWEWGSADVAAHGRIIAGRVGVGWRSLDGHLRDGLAGIARLWSPPSTPVAPAHARPPQADAPPVDGRTARVVGEQAIALTREDADAAGRSDPRAIGAALLGWAHAGGAPDDPPEELGPAADALALAGLPPRSPPQSPCHLSDSPLPGPIAPAPCVRLASLPELRGGPFTSFMDHLNAFAAPLGLRTFDSWSKIWEYPWLWRFGVSPLPLAGLRVVDLGSELSPMPWWLATRGASVTLTETARGMEAQWERVRRRLGVDVRWVFTDDETIPLPDAHADLVTSLSVLEHQPDKTRAMDEVARVLRPGGVLAMSFDICEPDMGMEFPAWNGRALTMAEFEGACWGHSAFALRRPAGPIAWNTGDIPEYLAWHRTTAPHHTYATAAAVLRRG